MNTIGAPGRQDGVSQEETESRRPRGEHTEPTELFSCSSQVLRKAAGFSLPLHETAQSLPRHPVHMASQSDPFYPQCAPILHTGEPVLSSYGTIKKVELKEKPDLAESPKEPKSQFFHPKSVLGFQVAYVVFQKPSGVSAALNLKGPLLPSTESHPVKNRIHKWISDYEDSVVDPEALRIEVDTFMEAYDKKIAEEETRAKEEEGVPDEKGWVKVTHRGCRPVLPWTEAASLRVLEKERRKRACKELLNFYAWQHRETKMEHSAQLRKKFEKDKQRTELMRAQRKFRPY